LRLRDHDGIKVQRKYYILKVAIILNNLYICLFQRGDWVVSFNGLLIRWYQGTWNLQQCKKREKFQVVLNNIPDDILTEFLFVDAISHHFLVEIGCKYYKIVKDLSKGFHKLITYYRSYNALERVLNTKFNWQGMKKQTWQRHFIPNPFYKLKIQWFPNSKKQHNPKRQDRDAKVLSKVNTKLPHANVTKLTNKAAMWTKNNKNKLHIDGTD
jgi:hypothetical protein